MNERIKQIREYLEMSRSEFGKKLGVSGDVVNNLERGRVEIKEDRIKLICSVFDVDESWLRTGNGEMYQPSTKNQEISDFLNDIMELDDKKFKKRFIESFARLEEKDWEHLEEIVTKLFVEQKKED